MRNEDKILESTLTEHIDLLYKMVSKINVNINVDHKAMKSSVSNLINRIEKLEKGD